MTDSARRRAEACFAVARSATIPGERDAALNRGKAIAEAAGLDLDLFDIPGRAKTRSASNVRQSDFADALFTGGSFARPGFSYNFRDAVIDTDDPRFADLLRDVIDEIGRRGR